MSAVLPSTPGRRAGPLQAIEGSIAVPGDRGAVIRPLVEVHDLAKIFDVSAPWLNRVIERKPRQFVHAVDGISFSIQPVPTTCTSRPMAV